MRTVTITDEEHKALVKARSALRSHFDTAPSGPYPEELRDIYLIDGLIERSAP